MKNLSWHLNVDINNLRSLFSETILPYDIDFFICECGNVKTIIKYTYSNINKYICDNCDNESFLDVNDFSTNYQWYDSVHKIFEDDFLKSLVPEVVYDEDEKKLKATISISIPNSFDLASDKVIYMNKDIFEISIEENGTFTQNLLVNFDLKGNFNNIEMFLNSSKTEEELVNQNELLSEYKKKILVEFKKYVDNFKSKILKDTTTVEEFSFFVKNPHLNDIEFYKWDNFEILNKNKQWSIVDALDFVIDSRLEKSLKRYIFNHYSKQILIKEKFDPILIYSLARCIKDVNVLNRILKINLSNHIKDIENKNEIHQFLKFLSNKFSDKQLERLLLEYELNYPYLFIDSVLMFGEITEYIDELDLVKCKAHYIHNEIVKFHRYIFHKHMYEIKLNYEGRYLEACVEIEEYKVELPKDGIELYNWSDQLQNCLSGYWNLIKENKTTVYGFFLEDELMFAVEIKNNLLVQAKLKYNEDLESREMDLVQSWYQRFFILDKKELKNQKN